MLNTEKRPYSSPALSSAPQVQAVRNQTKETLEVRKHHVTKDQWSNLLELAKMTNREQDWLNQTFSFPGGNKIRIKNTLDLTGCHSLVMLPKGLEGGSIFLSSQLSTRIKDKFNQAKQEGDIKCTIIYF